MEPKTYRLAIEPLSSFLTPLDADTIFGHIAWIAAYREEEKVFQKLLNDFKATPPFVISSGFPEGKLPVPVLGPIKTEDKKILLEELSKKPVDLEDELKEIKRIRYISIHDFKNGLINKLSSIDMVRYLLRNRRSLIDNDNLHKEQVIMRTAINRYRGSAEEGRLFDHSEIFYDKGTKIDIWIRFFDIEYREKVEKWFRYLESHGYGANVSTGSGQFRINSFSEAEGQLPESSSPNAFMTISNFTPKRTDPIDGYYHYTIKRGKLGGHWSAVGVDGCSKANVWKSPLVMFEPGSVFKTEGELQRFYGRIVENIYPAYPNIIQYALAFPIGVKITG